jgi:hypothetical protein
MKIRGDEHFFGLKSLCKNVWNTWNWWRVILFKLGWPMTKSCALLNFDRLYVTSYDVIWKKGGKQIWVSNVCLLLDLLISLYFNRKFTRKLLFTSDYDPPPFPPSRQYTYHICSYIQITNLANFLFITHTLADFCFQSHSFNHCIPVTHKS